MERTLTVGLIEDDETGGRYFDRQNAEARLSFALDTVEHFGGTWGIIPLREQQADGEYALVGLKLIYNSLAPAKKHERVVAPVDDAVDDAEPVAA